ncbi:MAG: hypothetical protein ACWA44_07300 [Thiotrichales bacterium]
MVRTVNHTKGKTVSNKKNCLICNILLSAIAITGVLSAGCASDISDGGNNLPPAGESQSLGGASQAGATLYATPSEIEFGESFNAKMLVINSDVSDLGYVVSNPEGVLSFSPEHGELSDGSASIMVSLDREKLTSGQHAGSIVVDSGVVSISIPFVATNGSAFTAAKFSDKVKYTKGYKFEPETCELNGPEMECSFVITNEEDSGWLTIYSGWYNGNYTNTRFFVDGKEYRGDSVTLSTTGRKETQANLINNVPMLATIKFVDMPTDLTSLENFEVRFRDGRLYEGEFFGVFWDSVSVVNQNY